MAPTEAERFELREGLRDVLEEEHVTTLMESLPPMDWHELATKSDLAALEERMNARFEGLDARFERVDARFTEMRGEMKLGLSKQTYVVLVGMAAMLAGALTPVYLAVLGAGG